MVIDFELDAATRALAAEILPLEALRLQSNLRAAMHDDGSIDGRAVRTLTPWQRADMTFPGVAVTGSNIARIPFPQGANIRHICVTANTPPSGGNYHLQVVSGGAAQNVSLQSSVQSLMAPLKIKVEPQTWVQFGVMEAGGAADVFVTLHYTVWGSG